ncbi:MAG: type II CAAX endopeptidase family protein, partial [candidate division Zixibacteria bacterium]|nr:type II CAAX endopeptidase family protein [candidate division Zixibacteria bacterium]
TYKPDRCRMTDEIRPAEDGFEPTPQPFGPFTPGLGTYILLFFLVVVWTTIWLLLMAVDTTGVDLTLLNPMLYIYLPTIIIEWLIFLAVVLAVRHEGGRLSSLGFTRPKVSHAAAAVGFLVVSNLLLAGFQFLLEQIGLPVSKDVDKIVEQAGQSVWWWLALSVTAGVCEEACFRGYLMTRLRAVIGRSWGWPVFLATLSFAAGHTYQDWGGLIMIFVYGLMFCALFLRTGSLWPGIFAHIIQDFAAIFIYRWFGF